ncbi:unnamed protein product [Nippostrongylus brasiliensis]|uniref:Uncharacterized protein n=1 Tax=Nippostrongylus brasiliensis TaxID=27835 RepID=A0A0N4YVJ9_NIPBR|nr:unnamed protein product [Nippostrongylus brasiliensis]
MDERTYTETRSPVTLNNTQCSEILSSTTHREKHWQSAAVPGNDNHRAKLCTNQLSPKGRKKPKARTKSKATQFKPSAKNSVKGKKPPSLFPYQGEDVGQIVGPSSAFTPVRKSRLRESVAFQDNVFDTVSAAFSSPVQYLPTMTIPLYSIASSLYEGINGSDSLDHMWSQGDHLSPSFYNENFQRAGESDEYLQAALEEQGGFDSSENGNWLSEIPRRTYTPLATPCCFAPQVHKQFLSNKSHSRAKVASAVLPFNIETLLDASNCERHSGSDHDTSRLHGPIAEVKKPGNDESIDAEGGSSNSDFDDKMSKRRMVLDEDKMSKRRMVLDIVSSSRPLTRSCGDLHEIPIEALGLEPKSVVRTPRDPNRPRAPPKPRKKRGRYQKRVAEDR